MQNQLLYQHHFPLTMAYINSELKRAGIDPAQVFVINVDLMGSADYYLVLPLEKFEKVFGKSAIEEQAREVQPFAELSSAQAKGVIAHEIGHIQHRDFIKSIFYPVVAWGGAHVMGYFFPKSYDSKLQIIVQSAVKLVLSHFIIKGFHIIDEYRADSAVIKRFADDKWILADFGHMFLDAQSWLYVRQLISTSPLAKRFARSSLTRSPLFWHMYHLFFDGHPSDLSRAKRFFDAAGERLSYSTGGDKSTSQKELSQLAYHAAVRFLE